ncbi:dnaD and phage-associated domain protein [Streptococcus pyogenes]|nr:dnaD and phage-associated domain protein [Streptococcus pyogenes]
MYFTNEQFMELLKCSNKTVVKAKKELHDLSLLREVRQGINKPNRLYINGSVESTLQDVYKLHHGSVESTLQDVYKLHHGSVESTLQDVYKLHTINTNIINTNISNYYDDKGTSFLEEIENLWGRQFNGYEVQQINRFLLEEHISNDLLKKAIETSLANGARNMNYVSAVINNWIDSGITTVEQVDAAQELRLKQKSKTNSKDEEVSEYDTW